MDWATVGTSLGVALAGGGLASAAVALLVFRRQGSRDKWRDFLSSFERQIESAERRGGQEEVSRLRREYEGQLEAWRAQQGVKALAPRSISLEEFSLAEAEQLRLLLAQSHELSPNALSAEDRWLRGNAYFHDGENQEAILNYNLALQLKPDFPEVYLFRGTAYRRLGDNQKAVDDFTEAIKLKPDYSEGYLNRGVAYVELAEYQKAEDDYNEALRLRPHYTFARYNLACLHSRKKDIEPCVSNLERAVQQVDEPRKDRWRRDPGLEWARQDERVRKLLGMEDG